MERYTLTLLGPFQLQGEGHALTGFESDKVRGLLAYLATEPRAHRRETLATLLWPETSEQTARRNLSQALYNLRRVTAPVCEAIFEMTARTIRFVPDKSFEVDVLNFERILHAVDQHPHPYSILCDECHHRLASAACLHQGEFLAGLNIADSLVFDDWMRQKREALQRSLTDALEALANTSAKLGDYGIALKHLQRLLEIDPLSEGVCRETMRLLILCGRRNDALRQYERFRQTLWSELGVEPEAATQALYHQILTAARPDDIATYQQQSPTTLVSTGGAWADAQLQEVVGEIARAKGDHASAREAYDRALQLYQDHGDRRGVARSLCYLGLTARDAGDLAQAMQLIEQGREIYLTLGERFDAAEANFALARVLTFFGEFSRTISLLSAIAPVYRELGLQQRAAYVTMGLGLHQMFMGQFAEARATVKHGLQLSYALQNRLLICWGIDLLGMIALCEGDDETAEQLLRQALVLARVVGRPEELGGALGSLGYLSLKKGRARQAADYIREGLRLVQESRSIFAALCALSTAALYMKLQGDVERAGEIAASCQRFALFCNSAYFATLFGSHFGLCDGAELETSETPVATEALWRMADSLSGLF